MKVAITGHTRGIGKEITNILEETGFEVRGYSSSTGFNVMRPKSIVKDIVDWDADIFINNAYAPDAQVRLLYLMYENWQNKNKMIINLGAISSDSVNNFKEMGYNPDWTTYVSDKARLDFASKQLSNLYKKGKCKVTNIRPGFVKTDSTSMFESIAGDVMMSPRHAAELICTVIGLNKNQQIRDISFDIGNI